MGLYELVLFSHVAASVALLGASTMASPAVRAAVRRARTGGEIRAYLGIGRPLLILEPAAAMGVLASGAYLTGVAHFWSLGWIQVALVCWAVNAAVAAMTVKPAIERVTAAAAAAADGPVGADLDELRRSRRWEVGGDVLMATDAASLFVMVVRPELGGALLAVIGANLAAATLRLASRRGTRRQPPADG